MSEWIKISERLPDPQRYVWMFLPSGKIVPGIRNEGCRIHLFNTCGGEPTMWQEMNYPSPPPPPPSSFETWWETQRVMRLSKEVSTTYLIAKHEAKTVWDTAVAASKRHDFVP